MKTDYWSVVKVGLILVFSLFWVVYCAANGGLTNNTAAKRTLKAQGFRDVELTGWKPFTCADSDTTSTGFKATNGQGDRVEGVVCCGLVMKACTVRF